MKIYGLEDESDIASAAARILRETFIKNARTNTVLYVEQIVLLDIHQSKSCKTLRRI
ncbi:hypothetical protein [Acinetobacter haemolyticus]|uniref:Uncharacterized protein n=1 Tax=Acinetobacter haemolyticus TaxID=29430 RepID=A0AAW4J1F5_ACIHA|nr:hypothetical protein [Acinetobacter haemolyticus]MBO3656701.1 hypothetical protein [Acinetobacter haemolyticus]